MKRILLTILAVLVLAGPAFGATWYAQGSTPNFDTQDGDHVSSVWNDAANGSGAWLDWDTGPATGDVFDANAVTGIVVNIDPKGTAGATKVVLNNPSGGTFVITTGTITVTADIGVSGNTATADTLTVSGGTVTILGNIYGGTGGADGLAISGSSTTVTIGASGSPVTITGGNASVSYGVNDTHTSTTTTVYADITGGSNGSAHGYFDAGSSGTTNITGDITGSVGSGFSTNRSGAAVNITGDCIGSNTAKSGYGCVASSTLAITVIGNIVNGDREVGITGTIQWTPGAENYIKFDGGKTPSYYGLPPDGDKVLTTDYYIKSDDGVYTQGSASASSGGGGAWGF